MEDREKMVQLKMELGAENAESGEGSGRVGEAVSYTHLDVYKRQPSACLFWAG